MKGTDPGSSRAAPDRRRHLSWKLVVLVALLAPVLGGGLARVHFMRVVELKTEDLRYRIRGPGEVHTDLAVIEIDDRTIEGYPEGYPLPRFYHAALIHNLHQAGVKGIAFDMVFSGNSVDAQHDRMFLAALMGYGETLTLATFYQELFQPGTPIRSGSELPGNFKSSLLKSAQVPSESEALVGASPLVLPENLKDSRARLGQVNLLRKEAADGSIRHLPLLIQDGDGLLPNLALSLWLVFQGYATEDLEVQGDRIRLTADPEVVLPVDLPSGYIHEVAYTGDADAFAGHRFSYFDILNSFQTGEPYSREELEEMFRGKVVVVGLTAPSSLSVDHGATPFNSRSPLVYTHVNLLNNLMLNERIRRLPRTVELIWASLALLVGGFLVKDLKPAFIFLVLGVGVLVFLGLAQVLFTSQLVMVRMAPILAPFILGSLVFGGSLFLGQERERQILQKTFGAYVAPELLPAILDNAGQIELGGTNFPVTVVFVDIRGFTKWAQDLDPQVLVEELNLFLTEMVDVIFASGGSVNKFLGDAILAVFGAPLSHDDDAVRAVRAARGMRAKLAEHNVQRQKEGKPLIKMGIGLASGDAVAGNIGSQQRLEYTVIGNVVNLASRIQTLSEDGQILLDAPTRKALDRSGLRFRSTGWHELKGFHETCEVFELES